MDKSTTRALRESMQRAGLLRPDDRLDEGNRAQERWRYRHLVGLAMLAQQADPALDLAATSPEGLYASLARALPLAGSAIFSLDELFLSLARVEGRGQRSDPFAPAPAPLRPPWAGPRDDLKLPQDMDAAALAEYAQVVRAAIEAANAESPWRVGADRSRFEREYLESEAPDLFRDSPPGVMPADLGT